MTERKLPIGKGSQVILCAILGRSPLLEELARKELVDLSGLVVEPLPGEEGQFAEIGQPVTKAKSMEEVQSAEDRRRKWEVYKISLIEWKRTADRREKQDAQKIQNTQEGPDIREDAGFSWEGVDRLLLICGSDKRGTIYGMFSLSEYIGVSPLCFWGDAEPVRRERVILHQDIEMTSKEPSVKYRGFFINDEWLCFGNWATEHFGGFNREMYDYVFELLLRLKGNCLWPAMWSAAFPLDGPGSANEELAELYGIVIGYSHHDPCLRASEEWDKARGEESRYGNEWNFRTNEEGLLRNWEDGLKRSGRYEHIITVGMRGERDTSVLGADSLEENIVLLKNVITKQRKMIEHYVKSEYYRNPEHRRGEAGTGLLFPGGRNRGVPDGFVYSPRQSFGKYEEHELNGIFRRKISESRTDSRRFPFRRQWR